MLIAQAGRGVSRLQHTLTGNADDARLLDLVHRLGRRELVFQLLDELDCILRGDEEGWASDMPTNSLDNGSGFKSYLVELLREQGDLFKIANAFLLDPAGKLLHALGRNVPREEVGRVREVCRERAIGERLSGRRMRRDSREQLTTLVRIEHANDLGELVLVLANKLDRLLAELPARLGLARVAEDFLLLRLELEVQTDIDARVARRREEQEARGDLGERETRHAEAAAHLVRRQVVRIAELGEARLEELRFLLVGREELRELEVSVRYRHRRRDR